LTVIHTPGHTVECNCFLLTDRDGKEDMLFSGDTLFFGEVGRPDLSVSNDFTQEDLAGMLFDSLQKLRVLKPNCKLLPCHGSGSSCGKSIAEGNVCTLEKQFKDNYAFQIHSREEFIKRLTSDIAKPPQYYSYDSKLNQQGHKPFESLIK
jgi:hydroxyacylglutathione hydrolase